MSKMGNELERLLEENKYELLAVLREIVDLIDDYQEGSYEIDSYSTQPAKNLLYKIEKGGS